MGFASEKNFSVYLKPIAVIKTPTRNADNP
jgi:hypothetical protein